jgi:hypothetical protein
MRLSDSLLIAPVAFCAIGALVGATTNLGFSRLCLAVAVTSMLSLGLHWLLNRAQRRGRPRQRTGAADM